jgi:hypothetical protein
MDKLNNHEVEELKKALPDVKTESDDADSEEQETPEIEDENEEDTLYLERLARDNQVSMAVQVLKSWNVIQQIKSGGVSEDIQAD